MTKSLLIALLITTIPLVGYAQQSTYKDAYGNVVGRSDTNRDTTRYRDQYNNDIGSSRYNRDDNRRDYYDEYGNPTGSSERD